MTMRMNRVESLDVSHGRVSEWANALPEGVPFILIDAPALPERDARKLVEEEASEGVLTAALAYTDKSVKGSWRYTSAVERWLATRKRRVEVNAGSTIHSHKSKFRGCKSCGAQLPIERVKGELCPLCGADLRSASLRGALHGLDEKLTKLKLLVNAEASQITERDERLVVLMRAPRKGEITLPDGFGGDEKHVVTAQARKEPSCGTSRRPRKRGRTQRKSLSFDIETHALITRLAKASHMPKSRYVAELVKKRAVDADSMP